MNDYGGAADGVGGASAPADEVAGEIKNWAGVAPAASYDSVASFDGGKRIVQAALDSFGTVDVAVNNAGASSGTA